jgi:hypothetical protein
LLLFLRKNVLMTSRRRMKKRRSGMKIRIRCKG